MESSTQPDDVASPRGSGRTLMGSVSSASSAPPPNGHSSPDSFNSSGAFDPCEEAEFWKMALKFHKDGCMSLQRSPLTGKEKLLNVFTESTGATPKQPQRTPYRSVNLANMHRLYVRQLQIKLVSIAAHQQFDEDLGLSAMPRWGPTFQAYVQAVRDHEYMQQFSGSQQDPFIVDEARFHDSQVLAHFVDYAEGARADAYEESIAVAKHPIVPEQISPENPRAVPILSTRGNEYKRALWFRVFGFLAAGAFLVGPMWLLVLVRSVWVHLSVTTACVLFFGSAMVWWTATIETVLAGTFAYAAVLMVFVGVMMQELH